MSVKQQLFRVRDMLTANADVIVLLIRIVLGIIFIQTGFGKLIHFDRTVAFFNGLGIPFPVINAALAALTEFLGGILILVGLLTRLVSVPLAFVMLVAILTTKLNDIMSFSDFIRLQELDYMLFFLLLVFIGAGRYSLDRRLFRQ